MRAGCGAAPARTVRLEAPQQRGLFHCGSAKLASKALQGFWLPRVSCLTASSTAFENISQMAKQMTDIVDTNVKAATNATAQAAAALTPKK